MDRDDSAALPFLRCLDLGGGEGLRDEKEGLRLLRGLLGDREREVSEGV